MKFVTFEVKNGGEIRSGWLRENLIIDMNRVSGGKLPSSLLDFLEDSEKNLALARLINESEIDKKFTLQFDEVRILAPLPRPNSIRDFYAFEEHVKTARKKRGLDVIPEWYEIPVFYFTNHLAVIGPNELVEIPKGCKWMDYELEIACVIGKKGKDIPVDKADDYIFGYTIMNDWSARDIQKKEMMVGLGPAKGKDFATSIGPYLVTKDELEPYRDGKSYQLEMKAKVNGKTISYGNLESIYYSFGQMIERASESVYLHPGDVIGSGTVGTGCILELGPEVHPWLQSGDIVELEITSLGILRNQVK
ncbi:fumarylacetoacetate hydrolase family protein [Bacillus timonensis]|nr:fumarylacetoacetate hydrolase family protein [Bacillus timonensis]